MLHQINLWKIRHHAVTRIHPMFNVRRIEVMEGQTLLLQRSQQIDWHRRTVPWKRLDTIFFNTPLATSQFRKHLISIKFSHEHTETEPNIYDLWIKQINLQYNARSNKPCIQFQHKPIFLRKVHQGADFAEIPDRSFTLFVPMIEKPVCSVTAATLRCWFHVPNIFLR